MEDQICQFQKFGYCKLRRNAKENTMQKSVIVLPDARIKKIVRKDVLKDAKGFIQKAASGLKTSLVITTRLLK